MENILSVHQIKRINLGSSMAVSPNTFDIAKQGCILVPIIEFLSRV
jgi:hypothetical protein